jgi:hypothetical protein
MKEPRIIVSHLPNRPKLVLDKVTGYLAAIPGEVPLIRGACSAAAGKEVCLHDEDSHLFLQFGR